MKKRNAELTPAHHHIITSSHNQPLIPRREVLDNGVVLLANENRDRPSVAIRASWRAGGAEEAPGHAGLASFTARMLRRGAAGRDAEEISDAGESLGASFSFLAGSWHAALSCKGPGA